MFRKFPLIGSLLVQCSSRYEAIEEEVVSSRDALQHIAAAEEVGSTKQFAQLFS